MDQLGRYEVGPVLGQGGAGRVHRAVRIGPGALRTPVALKVLRAGGPELAREARLAALLRHRNLADVYEVGEEGGTWYCAMELCVGTVAEHVPLPPRAVVEVGLQVCAALAYAHDALALVHQDLKPTNLLLDAAGVVKVADLGIARARGFELLGIRGTPGYAAPEQVFGGEVDARADLYALGITLIELATGRRGGGSTTLQPPGEDELGSTSSTLSLDDLGAVDATTERGAPAWLQPAVARCLAADPTDRWPDMRALAAALRDLPVEGPGLREVLGLADLGPDADTRGALVGRQGELTALRQALAVPGVLAVLGAPGIGKSRLVAEVSDDHQRRGGRVFRCDLADVRTVPAVCAVLSRVLGVPLGRAGAESVLGSALAARGAALLVLDNAERVEGLGAVLGLWQAMAPSLRLWVTTRVALPLGRALRVDALTQGDAVTVLVQQARDRGVDVADDPRLAELAQQLDGVPLALELAAGRLGVLTVADLLERLDLELLRAGTSDRHGTLHGALEGSWALLEPSLQRTLAQLSIFEGGFTLAAAEAVLELGDRQVLDSVGSLVDRSLVAPRGQGRLRLLSTVRAFAAERLAALGEAEATAKRHGVWAAGLATSGPWGGGRQLSTVVAELENLTAAVRRAVSRGDGAVALDALEGAMLALGRTGPASSLVRLAQSVDAMPLEPGLVARAALAHARATWGIGQLPEALGHTDRAHRLARVASVRAEVLRVRGALLRQLGRTDEARVEQDAALQAYVALGDRSGEAVARDNLGLLHHGQGRLHDARRELTTALRLARAIGNTNTEGSVLGHLGLVHDALGDHGAAEACLVEALHVHRSIGDRRREAQTQGNLGALWRSLGRLDAARAAYGDALALHREVGNRQFEGIVLGNLGTLHLREGDAPEARTCWAQSLEIHREVGNHGSAAIVLGNLADLCLQEGELGEATTHCDAALTTCLELGHRRVAVWLGTLRARIAAAADGPEAGLAKLAGVEPMARDVADAVRLSMLLSVRTQLLAALSRADEARDVLAEAEVLAPTDNVDAQAALGLAREALEAVRHPG